MSKHHTKLIVFFDNEFGSYMQSASICMPRRDGVYTRIAKIELNGLQGQVADGIFAREIDEILRDVACAAATTIEKRIDQITRIQDEYARSQNKIRHPAEGSA